MEASAGRLARERIHLPVEHVAEEHRRLVVEVVAGGDHGVAVVHRRAVHEVALAEAAGGAGRAARGLLHFGDGRADALGHRLDDELLPARGGEGLALGLRLDRVVEDAEIEVEARRLVTASRSARPIARANPCRPDTATSTGSSVVNILCLRMASATCFRKNSRKSGAAEGGVVTRQLDDGTRSALAALHGVALPPDMTGRTSSSSPSPTTSSAVRRSLPRITSTVPGRMSSSRRTSLTRLRPASSTSRLDCEA